MYLIEKDNHNHNQRDKRDILVAIESSLGSVFQTVQSPLMKQATKNSHNKIHLVTFVQIQDLVSPLKLLWEFKLLQHVLIIKVCLSQDQPISEAIRSMARKKRQKIIFYLNHVNDMTFSENEGEFYFHSDSKVTYQYRQDNWYAIKNAVNLKLHLIKKIKKISLIFTKNIHEFLVKFKLVYNHTVKIQELFKIQTLYQLKYFLQENKRNPHYPPQLYSNIADIRKHSSQADLANILKFDQSLFNFIQANLPNSHLTNFFNSLHKSQSYEKLKYQFKLKSLNYSNFSQYYQTIPYHIVIPMEVVDVKNQTLLKQNGGFGKITKGLYGCKYSKTVHPDVNKQLEIQNSFSEQIFTQYLCKKSSLSSNCPSFQNEKYALMKLRNKKSPYIAQYYCNISKVKPFDDNDIYMDAYSSSISDLPIKLKHKIKIILQVIKGNAFFLVKGLLFLNSNGIIHRDMKPENVLVDKQMNSRIIDFGSCCNIYQKQNLFKPFDSKLRSTKGYFIKYQEYLSSVTPFPPKSNIMSKQQFYEHSFFDIYSYGKIINKLFNLEQYEFVHQDFLMSQFFYLKQKCCEFNPADRLTHQEIIFFIETLALIQKDNVG